MSLLSVYVLFVMVSVILVGLAWVLSESEGYDEEKLSAFECGFMSFQGSRLTFSLQFFLISIIFLIFDVEIALLLPIPVIFNLVEWKFLVLVFMFFIIIILGGLYYEWASGMLSWAY